MMAFTRRQLLGNVRRAIVKVDHSILNEFPVARIRSLAADIANLRLGGVEVVLVASGALPMGMARLDLKRRPRHTPLLQAVAAVGQVALIEAYEDALKAHRLLVGQVMLTRDDLLAPERFLRARHTLMALLAYGVIPIVSENASLAIDEIIESDDDWLSASLARLAEADLLVFLTAAEGIYVASPRKGGQVIQTVDDINALAKRVEESMTKGKMQHSLAGKVKGAQMVAADGVPTLMASGIRPGVMANILDDETIGTLLLPTQHRRSRKCWIAEHLKPEGSIWVTEEFSKAILEAGQGLPIAGVSKTEGHYSLGESVRMIDTGGNEFARGLANYTSNEIGRALGKKTGELETLLKYKASEEVIRRDDLFIL